MDRRNFFGTLAGAVVAGPAVASARTPKVVAVSLPQFGVTHLSPGCPIQFRHGATLISSFIVRELPAAIRANEHGLRSAIEDTIDRHLKATGEAK